MEGTISIIVPAYKTEPFIKKCVDSILAQTYRNLEVILVDDGSPDNCGAICDEYAALDSRVKVIHKPNGGLSDARNAGLDICTGAYIGFVDSDDWIEPNMYETLLANLLRFDADMSFGGVSDDVESNNETCTVKVSDYGPEPFSESNMAAMERYFLGSWSAWDKLYRAELFQNIRYPVGEINEDEAIVLHLLNQCRQVCYSNEVLYHYIHRSNSSSITVSSFSSKKLAWMRHCRDNLEYIRCHHPDLEPQAAARYRSSLLWSLTEIALSDGDFSEDIRYMRKQLKQNRSLFRHAPFQISSDRLRLWLLTNTPFRFYRTLIRLKRGH